MITPENVEFTQQWILAIYNLKRSLDKWAIINLMDLWEGNFQPSFMQIILNIDERGSSNIELAKRIGISKQALSKIVIQLKTLGVIEPIASENDKRSSIIFLSEKGKEIKEKSVHMFTELIASYHSDIDEDSLLSAKKTLQIVNKLNSEFN